MTAIDRKYVRIYYDQFAREFPDVWADDGLLATWLRMLVASEKAWPLEAEVPRSVKGRHLQQLVDRELVTLMPPHCYRIRGLDAERARRADAGRIAAVKRWENERNARRIADGNADEMPSTSTSTSTSTRRVNGTLTEQEARGVGLAHPRGKTA